MDIEKADFLIVTALEEEREAVLSMLPGWHKLPASESDVRVYYSTQVLAHAGDGITVQYRLVLVQPLGMGRVHATSATSDALKRWKPDYILLVGIAGGVSQNEVRLGDLLIADQVVDYELQRIGPGDSEIEIRYSVYRADARLMSAAMHLRGRGWQRTKSKRPRSGAPKRRIGPIASGDKVVARREFLERLTGDWPKLIGVEMEAGGAAAACFQDPRRPGFFMIRAVSDLADENKNSPSIGKWRSYACELAAAFTMELIKTGPVPCQPLRSSSSSAAQSPLPKAQADRFTVALAHLERDNEREVERLIIEALREIRGIRIVVFDRTISLEGAVPEESERHGHLTAHRYLDESGADVLIWGTALSHDGRAAPRLFFTNHLAGRRSAAPYVISDFRLPQIFWDDLADVVRTTVAMLAIFALREGRQDVAPELARFADRLRTLIAARDQKSWSARDYAAVQCIFGHALVLLADSGRLDLLSEAKTVLQAAVAAISRDNDTLLWASGVNVLTRTYLVSGQTLESDAQLFEAERLLGEVTREAAIERSPNLKAAIYTNLGYILFRLGERDVDRKKLRAAIRAFGTAYGAVSGNKLAHTGSILTGIGITLKELGDRSQDTRYLVAALKIHRKALKKTFRLAEPVSWIRVEYNMASVLQSLGRRTGRAELISEAVGIFRKVLKKGNRAHIPQDWAGALHNLGVALADLGELEGSSGRLRDAIKILRDSLAERTKDQVPLWWGATQFSIGSTYLKLGLLESDVGSIRNAIEAFELAAQAWSSAPRYRQNLIEKLAEAQQALADLDENVTAKECREAESTFDELLQHCDQKENPVRWASLVAKKADAITQAAAKNRDGTRLSEPVAIYQDILTVLSVEEYPLLWASSMFKLGYALRNLGGAKKDPALVMDALHHHLRAWAAVEQLSARAKLTLAEIPSGHRGKADSRSAAEKAKAEVVEAVEHDLSALNSLLPSNDYATAVAQYAEQFEELGIILARGLKSELTSSQRSGGDPQTD